MNNTMNILKDIIPKYGGKKRRNNKERRTKKGGSNGTNAEGTNAGTAAHAIATYGPAGAQMRLHENDNEIKMMHGGSSDIAKMIAGEGVKLYDASVPVHLKSSLPDTRVVVGGAPLYDLLPEALNGRVLDGPNALVHGGSAAPENPADKLLLGSNELNLIQKGGTHIPLTPGMINGMQRVDISSYSGGSPLALIGGIPAILLKPTRSSRSSRSSRSKKGKKNGGKTKKSKKNGSKSKK